MIAREEPLSIYPIRTST